MFVIGVTGGTSCGKKQLCASVVTQLRSLLRENGTAVGCSAADAHHPLVAVLSMESFYRKRGASSAADAEFNHDHPDAFDFRALEHAILELRAGRSVEIPVYDHCTRTFSGEVVVQRPVRLLLVEGILVLYKKRVRDLLDMKVFVDMDADLRLSRRVLRDTEEYGRAIDVVLTEYQQFVKPSFEEFTLPYKIRADIVIPRGADNHIALDLIVRHLHDVLIDHEPSASMVVDGVDAVRVDTTTATSSHVAQPQSPTKPAALDERSGFRAVAS